MELATSIGITITEFWEITPHELSIALKGFVKRKEIDAKEYLAKFKNEQDLLTYQAYLISRWVWQKKVDIKKYLGSASKKQEMTDEQMFKKVKVLNAIFGGEVIEENGKE